MTPARLLFAFGLALLLSACTDTPTQFIARRWQLADQLLDGQDMNSFQTRELAQQLAQLQARGGATAADSQRVFQQVEAQYADMRARMADIYLLFEPDGTYTGNWLNDVPGGGTWVLKDHAHSLELTPTDGEDTQTFRVKRITPDTLRIERFIQQGRYTLVFTSK
ncbi:MAG: hypothetical protein SFY70_11735 [Bacteroidia bacterium]|nr:hypothetical protein [Bacteroidia bacterium]